MVDFLDRVLQHLRCLPQTEDDVYNALRDAPELRLAWFTTPEKNKKSMLLKLQRRKFEQMLHSNVEDDGA